LNYYLYEGITEQNKEMISAEIRGLCLRWEPRVQIVEVKPINNVDDTENNTVMLDIIFTIPSLSSKQYKYSYTYNRAK
jgi:phage baseplate assembly protein W